MPFCLQCEFSFYTEQDSCPACGSSSLASIASVQTSAVQPDDSWVVIGGVAGQTRLELAKETLDSNNIPSVMFQSARKRPKAPGPNGEAGDERINGLKNLIVVPKEFQEEAGMILQVVLGDEFHRTDLGDPLM